MIRLSELQLRGYCEIESSPLPHLRDENKDKIIENDISVPTELKEGLGTNTGFRVLPHKMQNHYRRSTKTCSIKTIEYENEKIKAIFLPEYGGRLYSLYNKELKREMIYINSVFQPANLAIRNAWFSGGIEWNFGHYGHAYSTASPVYFAECVNEDGEEFLRMYEFEPVYKIYFQIDFYLGKDADYLTTYVKIINPFIYEKPLYYWSNTAVSELKNARVFSAANKVLYYKPNLNEQGEMLNRIAYGELPFLDGIDGDVSFPRNFIRSNEYFYQNDRDIEFPYEAVGYEDGSMFYECSTMPLRYRKMFCWGTHRGGTKWQDYLSHGDADKYVEVQAGIMPTQLHGGSIGPKSTIEFMQIFGLLDGLESEKYYQELNHSRRYVEQQIFTKHKDESLKLLEERLGVASNSSPVKIIHNGSPWGTIESFKSTKENLKCDIKSMSFTKINLRKEHELWLSLLGESKNGSGDSIDMNMEEICFMSDRTWIPYLEEWIEKNENIELFILAKAIILSENSDDESGIELLVEHYDANSKCLYLRTLGAMYAKRKEFNKALVYYKLANIKLADVKIKYFEEDFILEFLEILSFCNEGDAIWCVYLERKNAEKIITEEMYRIIAQVAFEKNQWDVLDSIFMTQPDHHREGDNLLVELWFKRQMEMNDFSSIEEARSRLNPPAHLDFRMN